MKRKPVLIKIQENEMKALARGFFRKHCGYAQCHASLGGHARVTSTSLKLANPEKMSSNYLNRSYSMRCHDR